MSGDRDALELRFGPKDSSKTQAVLVIKELLNLKVCLFTFLVHFPGFAIHAQGAEQPEFMSSSMQQRRN